MIDVRGFEKENLKDNFFQLMIEYPYLKSREKKKVLLQKAMNFAERIPEFKGWPHDDKSFWNAEAFMWNTKIDKELRQAIKNELVFRVGEKNLDLGAGNIVYTPNTVALDYSSEMLKLSDAPTKVEHNLEKPLPFGDGMFDSLTAVFVLNYIENIHGLINEMYRVLKLGGKLSIVQPSSVNDLYYLHVKNEYTESDLRILLKKAGFITDSVSKTVNNKNVVFFFCEKKLKTR